MPDIRVGISGWTYKPWRGEFYPDGLPQRLELAYASRRFNALEINGTFYSLQTPSSFESWREQTPKGFEFALKGGRYITHMRRLKDVRTPLANFFASGLLHLREKLGPILWQFPPTMKFDEDRFRAFFDLLPRDTHQLAALAEEHDSSRAGKVFLEPDKKRRVRHAVEFRHKSFLDERFVSLLREHKIAMVVADAAGKYPVAEDVSADWMYLRLHGARKMYQSGYRPKEIREWAAKIAAWHNGGEPKDAEQIDDDAPPRSRKRGRDVFVFFDNTDVKLRAPVDARKMAETLGVGPTESEQEVMDNLE